ncbi:hypothetical protein [Celerinatantimonas sp. YJH-8]|uniref:hypothetical protein n=1 Tax=Celerinatantimonas sp. YJH-8 TaxID=3228714 RepID=UPI0038C23422
MKLHKFSNALEIKEKANKLGMSVDIITGEKAKNYINFIFSKYGNVKKTGHISLDEGIKIKNDEDSEFLFFEKFDKENLYVFFEQDLINRNTCIKVSNGKILSKILIDCFGMEYFVSNDVGGFLVAVNWYTIHYLEEKCI